MDLDLTSRNRLKILFWDSLGRKQSKTRVAAGKRFRQQNLTSNVDVDLTTRIRFKISFSDSLGRNKSKTCVPAGKRLSQQNLT